MRTASRRALVVCALLWLAMCAGSGSAAGLTLRVRADRDRLPADGKSQVAIVVEVADSLGMPAPDGTRVHLATTLGRIVSPVQTVGGLAQSVLTAPRRPGVAIVSAMLGASRASLQVEFTAQPGGLERASRLVELSAEEISYSPDRGVFIATEGAELRCERVTITADGLQYDMERDLVRAQGGVSLRVGPRLVSADAVLFDLAAMKGDLLRLGEEAPRATVEGEELEEKPASGGDGALWEPLETGDTRTWVKARRAVISPGEKVILDHATFYVNGAPVVSLRRHVLDPSLGSAVFSNSLRYSSVSGVMLDLPWYYRASARRIGSLHITRNHALNGYGDDLGWAVGVREEYVRGDDVSGAFLLDDVSDPRRGIHWEHRQPIGAAGRLSLEAGAMSLDEEEAPRFRNANLNFYRSLSGASLSVTLSRMGYAGSQQSHGDVTYSFADVKTGGGVSITPSLHLRHSRAENDSADVLVDTTTGEPLVMQDQPARRSTSVGLDVSVHAAPWRLSSRSELTPHLTTGYVKNLSGEGQGLLDFRLSLDHRFSSQAGDTRNRATLTYSYSANPSAGQASLFTAPRQMVSLTSALQFLGCSITTNASQELGGSRRYGSVNLTRPLSPGGPEGIPLWTLRLSHFYTQADEFSAAHTRLSLSRAIGRYRASLCYSPQGVGDFESRPWVSASGYGYTYTGGSNYWVEFTAGGD